MQRLFTRKIQKNELAVDPPSMAYGKSRNAKKTDLGLVILEFLAKIKKWHISLIFRFRKLFYRQKLRFAKENVDVRGDSQRRSSKKYLILGTFSMIFHQKIWTSSGHKILMKWMSFLRKV